MKKLLFLLLAVLMALSSFTACQKTPESPIVVGKSNAALIDKAIGYEGVKSGFIKEYLPRTTVSRYIAGKAAGEARFRE